ncbi:hypothetical protein UlMin_027872, partial [Ulmus minor]
DPVALELVIPDCCEGTEIVPQKSYFGRQEGVGEYIWYRTKTPPVVSNVRVVELSLGKYSGEGEYFGGYEGASLFSWYRETNDGTVILINGATSRTYEVTDKDYNCRLLFGDTPARSDFIVGELKLSEPTDIVLP